MAGIPPLIGFFAKQQVLYSALQSGYYFISIVAILVSVISASYYLQIVKVMHFDLEQSNNEVVASTRCPQAGIAADASYAGGTNDMSILTNTHTFLISVLTLSLLLFMLKPSILLNSTCLMALNIFYS
jgi:NADH-ubiquinone oxidoreductase chain 2